MHQDNIGPDAILELGLGFWASKTLLSAIELEVFTTLARQPMDAQTLAAGIGIHERSARDLFDALTALGMLDRDDGVYRNTPATDQFLDKRKPSYVGGLLEMCNTRLYDYWGNLTEGLRSGKPQNEAKHGGQNFDKLYGDPEKLREFLGAMTGMSLAAATALATKFSWDRYRTFADIGCAEGATPAQITLHNAHLRGTGFDLPPVGPVFRDYAKQMGVDDRLEFVAGDFFSDDLPTADVIVMGHILQHWSLEQKNLLVRKAYQALPDGGALVVYDWIVDDERREKTIGLLMSLNMLIETPDGFDYTGADCRGWMSDAGFHDTRTVPLTGLDSMVIGFK